MEKFECPICLETRDSLVNISCHICKLRICIHCFLKLKSKTCPHCRSSSLVSNIALKCYCRQHHVCSKCMIHNSL